MRYGYGLGALMPSRPLVAAVVAALASINAEGWSAEWADGTPPTFQPDTNPQTINVARQGFDATGAATIHNRTRLFTRRKRNIYPNHATDTASTIALDDYVYATDTVAGVPQNNSTETSPKPVAAWSAPHRRVIGNTIGGTACPVEVVAFHRNGQLGRFIACAKFLISDGTTTIAVPVAAAGLSVLPYDQQPLPVFALPATDISALNPGLITVNAEVYPWIGGAASVLKSVDQTALRDFSPRYFLKNATIAATPPMAYIAKVANAGAGVGTPSSAGVFSTSLATAKATPFDTYANMLAARGSTAVDGLLVVFGDDGGTPHVLSTVSGAKTQNVAYMTLTRDPGLARANARISWGAAALTSRLSTGLTAPLSSYAIRFNDISVVRTGASFLQGDTGTRVDLIWEDVTLDNGGYGAWVTRSDNYFYGVTVANAGGGWLNAAANGEQRIVRGVAADLADSAWENWWTFGCAFTRAGVNALRVPTQGALTFQNKFLNHAIASGVIGFSTNNAGETVTGAWVVQNLLELTRTSAGPTLRMSADGPIRGNTDHCGIGHNTVTGQGSAGRYNFFYDNSTDGDRRTHRRMWHAADIITQLNTKGDVNIAEPLAIGNFAYHHGVGCRDNWTQFEPNAGTSLAENQVYPGPRTVRSTSNTVRNDPGFTNYQAVTAAGAGAGGGDYRLTGNAVGRGTVPFSVLSHDLAGQARPSTNDTRGAYA